MSRVTGDMVGVSREGEMRALLQLLSGGCDRAFGRIRRKMLVNADASRAQEREAEEQNQEELA